MKIIFINRTFTSRAFDALVSASKIEVNNYRKHNTNTYVYNVLGHEFKSLKQAGMKLLEIINNTLIPCQLLAEDDIAIILEAHMAGCKNIRFFEAA